MGQTQENNGFFDRLPLWQALNKPVRIRDGHDNFFTPLRLLMACLVMIGHASVIANRDINAEPRIFFDYGFSYLAVNLFFIASGFLVTKSMAYRGDIADYSSARLLRIYPALIVHVLFVMFIIGPLSTTVPIWEFLTHPDVWKQPLLVLSFIDTDFIMPGVFAANEEPFASAPLWTLRYELLAYIATALAFSLGLMRRKWMMMAQFILPAIAWLLAKELGIYDNLAPTIKNMLRFGIVYGLGAAIYAYRERLSFSWIGLIGMSAFALLLGQTFLAEIATDMLLAYGLMFFAYMKVAKLNGLQKLSDVSYGIYIYHWCILQMLFQWFPSLNDMTLLAIGAPITIAISYASWHWIEKPILQAKSSFAATLRLGRKPRRFDTASLLQD
jgi:peptidoglycan/LPS O-acetylase OafA/YrhL